LQCDDAWHVPASTPHLPSGRSTHFPCFEQPSLAAQREAAADAEGPGGGAGARSALAEGAGSGVGAPGTQGAAEAAGGALAAGVAGPSKGGVAVPQATTAPIKNARPKLRRGSARAALAGGGSETWFMSRA
jgi:hypothetical protein